MTELEKIKELTPKFQLSILNNVNIIDNILLEIICVDVTKDAKDIRKRIKFGNHYEKRSFQKKIDLVKVILETNHPNILKKHPKFFDELAFVKRYRNSLSHSSIHWERETDEKNVKLVLHHRTIKKQVRLSRRQMLNIMKKAEKCTDDTRKIFSLIGKTKGLRF